MDTVEVLAGITRIAADFFDDAFRGEAQSFTGGGPDGGASEQELETGLAARRWRGLPGVLL